MHESMYRHPVVMENVEKLRSIGVEVLMPRFEEEKAKIPGTEEIVEAVIAKVSGERRLEGSRVLITAGPTREYLDGFRFISNPSSGKMGIAIAEEALRRGAGVTLVYGPGTEAPPPGADVVRVETTEEMLEAVVKSIKSSKHDIAILSAAAADYGAKDRKMIKTPSGKKSWKIELKPVPKIIEQVKKADPDVFLVGFKAEFDTSNEELVDRASKRMEETGMDLVVANDVAREQVGFGTDTNEVFIVDRDGGVTRQQKSKREIAEILLNIVEEKQNDRDTN
jgi:phosphopantothenoylcysteine decarboxylase/phosphopantothenate--cysteine ligase